MRNSGTRWTLLTSRISEIKSTESLEHNFLFSIMKQKPCKSSLKNISHVKKHSLREKIKAFNWALVHFSFDFESYSENVDNIAFLRCRIMKFCKKYEITYIVYFSLVYTYRLGWIRINLLRHLQLSTRYVGICLPWSVKGRYGD